LREQLQLNNVYHAILFLNKWGKIQSPINTNWFKPCVVGEQTKIYSKPDSNSTPIIELTRGNEIEMGVIKKVDGEEWIAVSLPNGQWGYMPGESKIILSMQLSLFENEVVVYSEPSKQSAVITHMKKNIRYDTIPSGSQDEAWVKICDSSGNEGFIDGQTRGKVVQ
jgi:hypothetical protein